MFSYVCTSCGYEGKRRVFKPGRKRTEVLIWALLFFPGPFYTAWRIAARTFSCPNCGKASMVRTNSERGISYLFEQEVELSKPLDDDLRRF